MPKADTQPVPEGTRLLHVGPYKTGTTALQAAMWAARAAMLDQGVRLAGRSRNPASAVRAVTGRASPYSAEGKAPPIARWNELARELRKATESRVVVSSEFLAWADVDTIRRIVDDVGEHVHAAVTLRPLVRIMPSMWQQNVQTGSRSSFESWLRGVLREPPEQANREFWTLQRHDALVDRWVSVLGPERVTAVVVNERDHLVLMHVFERLLGLREGTLVPQRDLTNRSLTLPEAEAVRALNLAFHAEKLPKAQHARLVRFGAAQLMKRREPASDEPRVEMPAWAIEPTLAIQRQIVERIAVSGANVIGELDSLARPPEMRASGASTNGVSADSVPVSPEIAAAMSMGVVIASGGGRRGRLDGRFEFAEPVEVTRVPTYQVAGVLALRGWRALVGIPSAIAGRLRPTSARTRELEEVESLD